MAVINNVLNANSVTPLPVSRGGTGVSTIAAGAIVIGNGASAVSALSLTNGQLPIGSTGLSPVNATLTSGPGISIANGAGSITISTAASIVNQTSGGPTTMAPNTVYFANSGATLCSFVLPVTSGQGDSIEIVGMNAGLWSLGQAASQQIFYGNAASTSGVGGSVAGTLQYDCIRLRCSVANLSWVVVMAVGNHNVV